LSIDSNCKNRKEETNTETTTIEACMVAAKVDLASSNSLKIALRNIQLILCHCRDYVTRLNKELLVICLWSSAVL
jgi:hypothetical protein